MSKRLGAPESTVRRWKDRYEAYMPTVGSGRTTRYKPEALEALRLIQGMAAEDAPWEDIEAALQAGFARTIEASSPEVVSPSPAVTALSEMVREAAAAGVREELGDMRDALERAELEHARALAQLHEELAKRDEYVRRVLEDRLPERETRQETIWDRLRRVLRRQV